MPRLTKKIIARNERIEQVVRTIDEDLGKDHADALGAFADYCRTKNIDWVEELKLQWYQGRDANFRTLRGELVGHFLRQIRNHPKHGPAFYRASEV